MKVSLSLDLSGHLLDLNDDELRGLQRRETDVDVDDTEVDHVLRRSFLVALDEVGVARRLTLERALAEQIVHEGADVQPNLRPERFVVGFKDDPLRAAIEAFFEVKGETANGNIFPFRGKAVVSLASPGTPHNATGGRQNAQAVDAER